MCMYVHCTCMYKAISNFLDRVLVLDFLELAQPEAPPEVLTKKGVLKMLRFAISEFGFCWICITIFLQ